jgi:Tfp pilus assembly protein PilP
MQFPTQSMDWLFDYVPLNGAPPLDGLQAWELFALASKQMVAIRKLCSEKQWRLVCVAPLATLAQAQLGAGACFYPTRQHRQSLLWRKRCTKGGLGLCASLVLFLGVGSGYSLASAYWADSHHQTKEDIAQALPPVESLPSPEPWMLQEFERTKEPLEFYNLQDLRLVGFIQQGRSTNALIHVSGQPQLGIHSVRLGAYLGKNFGRVSLITHDAVLLLELHQDSSGVWTERETSLQMASHVS